MIQAEEVDIAATHPPARNVRRHPEAQLVEIQRSVEMFGQLRNIVIDEAGQVLAGNGLVEAFKRMQRQTIMAFRVTGLNDAQKTKLMLADNRTFDLGLDDNEAILAAIRSLDDYDVPGFDAEVIRRLTATNEEVAAAAVGGYGTMSPELQHATADQRVPSGSTDPGASAPTGQHTPSAAEGTICPRCGFTIPRA